MGKSSWEVWRLYVVAACLLALAACADGSGPGQTTATISGQVTDASNSQPIAGAMVTTQPVTATVTTDAQGNYTLANVNPGSYTVNAAKGGYQNGLASATVVTGQTATANIALTLLPGTISGRVTDASNSQPIAGATVTTQPATTTVTTDAQGNYTIPNVAPGGYTVNAAKSGYQNGSASATVVAGQTATANIALTPLPAAFTRLYLSPILEFKLRTNPTPRTSGGVELCLSTMTWSATVAEDMVGTSYAFSLGVKTAFNSSGTGTLQAEIIHKRGSTTGTVLASTTFTTTTTYEVKTATLTGPDPDVQAGDSLLLRVRIVPPSTGLPCVAEFSGPGTDNFIDVPRTTVSAAADYTLSLTPATLTIAQGANGTATVNIARTDFTGAVTLSLGNAPAGVTGSFNPAASTGTSATLTVSVGAAVAPGVYNLTLDGTATAGNRSTPLTLTVSAAAGWTLENSGTTNTLNAVWGTASNDVFAVGNAGTILHRNGSAWSPMTSGTTEDLRGVWGFASNDVYVVGRRLTVLHYDGNAWTTMSTTHPAFLPSLNAIWGSASDLWAVGSGYLRMHYNGSSWSGTTNIITNSLHAVWGSSASNVLAVGDFGSVYRHNGSTWSGDLDVTGINDLWLDFRGIWGATSTDVFVVGDYDPNGIGDGDSSGTVLKFDGSQWSFLWRDQIPELRAIWGTSTSDFFVVGLRGAIAHHDGTAFQIMDSGITQNLLGIWGAGGDVFAVGASGTILHHRR